MDIRDADDDQKMLIDAHRFAARFLPLPEVAVDGELASSEPPKFCNSHGATANSCAVLADHVDTTFLASPVQGGASSPIRNVSTRLAHPQ